MGERNGSRSIPSLFEYKTIRLRDRYSSTGTNLPDALRQSGLAQRGDQTDTSCESKLREDSERKDVAAASMSQLPASLASYGGLHSFSQMAQYIPTIYAPGQRAKKQPSALRPLPLPGLAGSQEEGVPTDVESRLNPYLKNIAPEVYLSSSTDGNPDDRSTLPLDSLLKDEQKKQSTSSVNDSEKVGQGKGTIKAGPVGAHKSNPAFGTERLPPIKKARCRVHSDMCTCVQRKMVVREASAQRKTQNVRKKVEVKTSPIRPPKRHKEGHVKKRLIHLEENTEERLAYRVQKHDKRGTSKKSSSSNIQSSNVSSVTEPMGISDTIHDEEEGTSSHHKQKRFHFGVSPTATNDETRHDHVTCGVDEMDEEFLYFHKHMSVLHTPPPILPPITGQRGPSCNSDLLARHSEQRDDVDWARDDFIDDSALRRAISLRNRALYNNSDASASNTTTCEETGEIRPEDKVDKDQLLSLKYKRMFHTNGQKGLEPEILEIRSVSKKNNPVRDHSKRDKVKRDKSKQEPRKRKEVQVAVKTIGKTQNIRSMTWQEVSPHLGPKKDKATLEKKKAAKKRKGKLHGVISEKKTTFAAQALRQLQKNRVKHTDHSNCISTISEQNQDLQERCNAQMCIQNLPPVQLFRSEDISISCAARTSKSLGSLTPKVPDPPRTDASAAQDAAVLFASSFPKFLKLCTQPVQSTTGHGPADQSGREKHFKASIDGTRVKRREFLALAPSSPDHGRSDTNQPPEEQ